MTIEEIKELIQIFNESGVGEMELQRGKDMLRLRRSWDPQGMHATLGAPPAFPHAIPPPVAPGTFYEASAPGAPPFVKIGDAVEPGQVLCIIESMKLMNEIEAEVAGVLSAKLVESGRPVEYGEALFAIQPR
jgi:acetyl-CoA carboxylase biotin carboxyl carrier protein